MNSRSLFDLSKRFISVINNYDCKGINLTLQFNLLSEKYNNC